MASIMNSPRGINWMMLCREKRWLLSQPYLGPSKEEDRINLLLFFISSIQDMAVNVYHVPADIVYDRIKQAA